MLMHMSIFSVSLTAPMPKMRRALMMPMPRSSIKWRMFSGAWPTRDLLDTRRISTASSAMSRWPRLMSSMAGLALAHAAVPHQEDALAVDLYQHPVAGDPGGQLHVEVGHQARHQAGGGVLEESRGMS